MEVKDHSVLLIRHPMASGGVLLQITLNNPNAMNALSLSMIRALQTILDNAEKDDDIHLIFLDAVGDKAFCAGGDIVELYNALVSVDQAVAEHVLHFFSEEYALDYTIHSYPKPIVAWGNGIVMGGGMGLFSGASFKIVTENTRIAMPELSIGLIPDVGASHFLNHLPPGVGLFLGLTGTRLSAFEALDIGLADTFIQHTYKSNVIASLCQISHVDISHLTYLFKALGRDATPSEPLLELDQAMLSTLDEQTSVEQAQQWIIHWAAQDLEDPRLEKAALAVKKASPLASKTFFEQLSRGKTLSLQDCFKMELALALACACEGDFKEGIRALLIDKDDNPHWRFTNVDEVPDKIVLDQFHFFELKDLANPLFCTDG
ncbi:MAG: enoyl-CoA hydratase/isomerase family protein [Pseudomonadota bacterium]